MTQQSLRVPRVTVIIPSWSGEVGRVLNSLERQTFREFEVDVVRGVSPAARARNTAAGRARGEILVFIDDDAYFGNEHVLENLIRVLDRDSHVAVVGTSKIVPETATELQKAIARQVPRMTHPVGSIDTPSDPPLYSYGFSAVTTTCCAVRRDVFEQLGGFDEELPTGPEDTDFFYRLHRRGYNVTVAGGSWVYHDPPASLWELVQKSFWYGMGHAAEVHKYPERGMAVLPLDRWYGKLAFLASPVAFPLAMFVHYYFDPHRQIQFGFRPLKTLSTYAVLCGYVYGWYRDPRRQDQRMSRAYRGRARSALKNSPARVLYVDAFPKFGGGQQVLLSVIARLAPERYQALVGVPPGSMLQTRLTALGYSTVTVPFDKSNYTLPNLRQPTSLWRSAVQVLRAIRAIVRIARDERADLIHANSAVAGVHALPAAIWLGLPCAVHSHDFLTATVTNTILKLLLRYRRSAIIFVSHALARYYRADQRAAFAHRVIPNGVDVELFRPDADARGRFLRECGLPGDVQLVGAVGRIELDKGFGLLLEAFARVLPEYARARLVVVGDVFDERMPGARQALLETVHRLGLEGKVVFTGFREDMPTIMAALDILVHCPVAPEGFGLILAEAMACARPVIAVPAGGMTEVVRDGENGLLTPVGDVPALAATLAHLLSDPALAKRLGETGYRIVHATFTAAQQAERIQQLYDELLRRDAIMPAHRRHSQVRATVGGC